MVTVIGWSTLKGNCESATMRAGIVRESVVAGPLRNSRVWCVVDRGVSRVDSDVRVHGTPGNHSQARNCNHYSLFY